MAKRNYRTAVGKKSRVLTRADAEAELAREREENRKSLDSFRQWHREQVREVTQERDALRERVRELKTRSTELLNAYDNIPLTGRPPFSRLRALLAKAEDE